MKGASSLWLASSRACALLAPKRGLSHSAIVTAQCGGGNRAFIPPPSKRWKQDTPVNFYCKCTHTPPTQLSYHPTTTTTIFTLASHFWRQGFQEIICLSLKTAHLLHQQALCTQQTLYLYLKAFSLKKRKKWRHHKKLQCPKSWCLCGGYFIVLRPLPQLH